MNEKKFIKQILTIKEYKATLNSFLEEQKLDKCKKKPRYFVDLIQNAIQTNDLDSLLKIWKEYEIIYFKYLDFDKQKTADLMRSEMYKAFLIESFKNKRTEKINLFYQTMGMYMLSNKSEWGDWFEFPLIKIPSEHKVFGVYFTRMWIDNFFLSLYNFFMQVIRSVMSNENDLEKYFSLDMFLDNCRNQLVTKEIGLIREKYNITDTRAEKSKIVSNIISNSHSPRTLHDVTDLRCDFRETKENIQVNDRKISKSNKPKGLTHIIQNKTKSSPTTFIRKKAIPIINVEITDNKDNSTKVETKDKFLKIEEKNNRQSMDNADIDFHVSVIDDSNNSTGIVSVNIAPNVISETNKNSPLDSFGIKQLSNKISQKIFKPKLSIPSDTPKSTIIHEHFSMVTHVKFSRKPTSYWASLDVGGTFKIWSIHEPSKSLHTVSFKHTIYSFDWVSRTTNLILLGTKGGSIKLFNVSNNEIIHEMIIDSSYPRINIVQSFDNESKFVCESLDRSRATVSNSGLPHGTISLYDSETWTSIRSNLITLNSNFTVNCITCSTNSIISGCSNGSVQLIDLRMQCDSLSNSLTVFENEEVVNVIEMYQSKWSKSNLDSNYLICLSSKSHIKMFDIRQSSKSLPKESFHLNDLNIPLSWTEKPHGGEQTIYFPRANLISTANVNSNLLFSAAKKGILMQKINGSTLTESTHLNAEHNSPVICIDSSPCDINENHDIYLITGSMGGTTSLMKINNTSNTF